MPQYMVQKMNSGMLPAVTYYRKQSQQHVSHQESGRFTADAKQAYANANGIAEAEVEVGHYASGQGVPTGGNTQEI